MTYDTIYSLLYANDMCCLFFYNNLRTINSKINKYLTLLASWLYKWRLVMNAKKWAYTLFSKGSEKNRMNLLFKDELIPYNSNPVFLE